MNPSLLELRGVTVTLAGVRVLDGVDLSVAPNSIVTIVGPNGAGKTTLLRVALGLLAPECGEVRRRPALRIAYVPQRLAIEPTLPLTIRRFLSLAVPGHVPDSRLVEVLESVGAAHILESQVGEVSGGELQRAMLARAMLRRPELMVLDEPVGGVDVAGQAELYDRIARLRAETGCGVLMVSHDLHLVMASTDQVVCLNHHVCCAGHPHAVSRDPAYAALFGERVAASLAVYHHHHDHVHAPDGAVAKPREDEAHG